MTDRVDRHRAADAERRRVTTRGARVSRARPPTPQRPPRPGRSYRKTAAAGGLTLLVVGVLYLVGAIAWTTAELTSVLGTAAVSYVTYRVELAHVRRTGRPIDAEPVKPEPAPEPPPDPAPEARREDDLEPIVEPDPVDLDVAGPEFERQRRRTRPEPPKRPEPRRRQTAAEHARTCTANPPGGPTCRCPDGPNRAGKRKAPATRTAPARKTTPAKSSRASKGRQR